MQKLAKHINTYVFCMIWQLGGGYGANDLYKVWESFAHQAKHFLGSRFLSFGEVWFACIFTIGFLQTMHRGGRSIFCKNTNITELERFPLAFDGPIEFLQWCPKEDAQKWKTNTALRSPFRRYQF